MKKLLLSVILSFVYINVSFAETKQYYIIVDAGSSGSRLHLFSYTQDKTMPQINEILSAKSDIPLAAFAETPEKAYDSLKPLLDQAANTIKETHIIPPIPVSVLGTAGMRLLPNDQQQAIYQQVKSGINENYKNTFTPKSILTISGKLEGVYGWLDVNYLLRNFQNNTTTVGSIDVGGASTEIAYAIEKSQQTIDETTFTINKTPYIIFSKSFLGLGVDEARASMDIDQNSNSCYPKGYDSSTEKNGFDILSCGNIYNQIIENYEIKKLLLATYKTPKFIAHSGAYYTYHFFGADPNVPDQETLEQTIIKPTCSNTWDLLKKAYPTEPEMYLANHCGNSVFLTHLLYDHFQLQHQQINILSRINDNKIDWALGAMLYTVIRGET